LWTSAGELPGELLIDTGADDVHFPLSYCVDHRNIVNDGKKEVNSTDNSSSCCLVWALVYLLKQVSLAMIP